MNISTAPAGEIVQGRLRRGLLWAAVLAPLPFGCVEDWSRWFLVTALGLAAGLYWLAGGVLPSGRRQRLALLAAAGFVIWLGVQIVPLPPGLLARLSPEAHRLYSTAIPGYDRTDSRGYAYPDSDASSEGGAPDRPGWTVPSFTSWRSLSLEPYSTYRVACQSAALLAFAALGLALIRDPRHRRNLAWALVAAAAGQAVYGSLEAATGHQHIFAYEKRYYTDSATGTLVNRNHFAAMLNMALPLGMVILLQARARQARESTLEPAGPRLKRIAAALEEPLALACVVAIGVGVVLSRSRMGIATMLVCVLALTLAASTGRLESPRVGREPQRGSGRRRGIVMAALPLALLAVIGFYALGVDSGATFERFGLVGRDLQSGSTRPALWSETLPVAGRFLWTGAGAGAYPQAMNPHLAGLPLSDFWLYNHAHNDYLEAVTTLGVLGLLPAGTFLLLWLAPPLRGLQLAACLGLASLLLHSLTDFLLATPSNALHASALLVLVAPLSAEAGASGRRASRVMRGAAAAALLLALLAGPGRTLAAAMIYRPYWNTPLATPSAREALRLASVVEPFDPAYRRYLGQGEYAAALSHRLGEVAVGADLQEQVGRWRRARLAGMVSAQRRLLESLALGPVDYSLHGEIARIATEVRSLARRLGLPPPPGGESASAISGPHRASAELAPTAYTSLADTAMVLWRGRDDLGEAAAEEALKILARVAGRPEAWPARLDDLLRAADDSAELALIDRAVAPPPGTYASLLADPTWRPLPGTAQCARSLWAVAELRETRRQMAGHSAAGPPSSIGSDAREALLARVRSVLRVAASPEARAQRQDTCGREAQPEEISRQAVALLAELGEGPPPPASGARSR